MIVAFSTPTSVFKAFTQATSVGVKSKTLYMQLVQMKFKQQAASNYSLDSETMVPIFGAEERHILKRYLNLLAKMAHYNAYKQLFSMWRVGHVPLIYLLLFTGLAHVLAVHMY